jgi:hypothetical protein
LLFSSCSSFSFGDFRFETAFATVFFVVLGYSTVVALIDERVATWVSRSVWPKQSNDELGPPYIAKPRVWTFTPRWSVPFVQSLAEAQGFKHSRDEIEAAGSWFLQWLKVEEFADRVRIHQWLVTASGIGRHYEWDDRVIDVSRGDERDRLVRSAIWTLDLEKKWSEGSCQLRLSAPWLWEPRTSGARTRPRSTLRLVLWVDSRRPADDRPLPPQVIFDVPLDRVALDEQAQTGVVEAGDGSWHTKHGEGEDWEWSWSLGVR